VSQVCSRSRHRSRCNRGRRSPRCLLCPTTGSTERAPYGYRPQLIDVVICWPTGFQPAGPHGRPALLESECVGRGAGGTGRPHVARRSCPPVASAAAPPARPSASRNLLLVTPIHEMSSMRSRFPSGSRGTQTDRLPNCRKRATRRIAFLHHGARPRQLLHLLDHQ
jgi:hypothetical protein